MLHGTRSCYCCTRRSIWQNICTRSCLRPAMMILVSCQCGASSVSLFRSQLRYLVNVFPQPGKVHAYGLFPVWMRLNGISWILTRRLPMSGKRTTVTEGFVALITCMWSFAGMHSLMHSQCGSLDKLLSAFFAFIRSR